MRRVMLTLRYDGTAYHGWQVQNNAVTVQWVLQNAAELVLGTRPDITGCSRTDSGVHANMFCCHLDLEKNITDDKFVRALNAHLPDDIAVYGCQTVNDDFHARYSCIGKNYIYKIYDFPHRNPFYNGYALHTNKAVDVQLLNTAAKHYVGTHDFSGFCSSGSSVKDTVRTVSDASVTRQGDTVIFSVTADGFLYNMVRIMVGTLLSVAEGKIFADEIPDIINLCDRKRAGKTAAAHGLYLNKVYYDNGGDFIGISAQKSPENKGSKA